MHSSLRLHCWIVFVVASPSFLYVSFLYLFFLFVAPRHCTVHAAASSPRQRQHLAAHEV